MTFSTLAELYEHLFTLNEILPDDLGSFTGFVVYMNGLGTDYQNKLLDALKNLQYLATELGSTKMFGSN